MIFDMHSLKVPHSHYIKYTKHWQEKELKPPISPLRSDHGQHVGSAPFLTRE